MNLDRGKSKNSGNVLGWLETLLGEDVFFVPCELGTKVRELSESDKERWEQLRFGIGRTTGNSARFFEEAFAVGKEDK